MRAREQPPEWGLKRHKHCAWSFRAAIALLLTSQVIAALRGRDFVTPDDIKRMAKPVLRHRLILRPEAEIEGYTNDRVVEDVLTRVPVPR